MVITHNGMDLVKIIFDTLILPDKDSALAAT
jgi:hypothetical protein